MSTSVLKASPSKLDIKRHSPSILYVPHYQIKHLVKMTPGTAFQNQSMSSEKEISESAPSGVKIYSIERSVVLPTIFNDSNACFLSLYYAVHAICSLLCTIFF